LFHFLFRVIGLFVLALALVLAVLDITRSITASTIIFTSLAESWMSLSPRSLAASKEAIETWVHPFLWDPMLVFVLQLPSWLMFWFVAMFLLWLGQKRENPYGRFASR